MTDFRVIHPALTRCEKSGTDPTYGKCVRDVAAKTPELLLKAAPTDFVGKASKGETLVLEDLAGRPIDGSGIRPLRRACVPAKKGNPLGPCRVELDFPTRAEQSAMGIDAPVIVRKCIRKKDQGELQPVHSLTEALKVGQDFCTCSGDAPDEGKRRKCARSGGK